MPEERWLRYGRTGTACLTLLLCALSFLWAPHDPHLVDLSVRLQAPGPEYWLGTDAMGRDVLSRVLHGGKTTLGIVLFSGALIVLIGTPLGLCLGYWQGRFGWIFESLLNACTAFPPIAYMLVFMGAWGSGLLPIVTVLVLSSSLRLLKLVKIRTEQEKAKAYVQCAAACGASRMRIMFWHIEPNVRKDSFIFLSLLCADMVLLITSFSFIGLGPGERIIDWGGIILEGSEVSMLRPDLMFYPIVLVLISTLAFNVMGDDERR